MKSMTGLADRLLRPFEVLMAFAAGLLVLTLMVLGVAEVIGRSFFNKPIYGNLDIVEQLMVPVAAFGIAYCQSKFGNVRMTMLTQNLRGRAKWLVEALSLAIGMFVVFVYLKGSYMNLQRSLQLGGDTPEIGIPLWIGICCVTVSLALLMARLAVQTAEALRLVLVPDDTSEILDLQSHEIAREG
ncbi:TRAP transporter small permease [Pseudooceanicola sp.]|uniref:TRAP transporter small permease n=1 Tax=Pseudooceanicola sp. TaxID=1914328 RepID=UPI004059D13A|tara:strand:+ start:87 stop:641 length:555 start_codon:yes stop_codon:yes gene_type:complete